MPRPPKPSAPICANGSTRISFSEAIIGSPPYSGLFEWTSDGVLHIKLHLSNYMFMLEDSLYFAAYWSSIKVAFFSTLISLLIAYPMAYYMARSPARKRNILLLLVVLPFWTSFLLRVYAWIGILKTSGILNHILLSLGIISEPLVMIQTNFAVYIGIVYTYLPFMILPLFSNLVKLDNSLLEASSDLGASRIGSFFRITLPLSVNGIIAGSMLVFIPVIGEFVIPDRLGGPDTLMIGKVLWDDFFHGRDWPLASSVATVMLVLLLLPIMLLRHAQAASAQAEART
ncbi:MAG: putrescine ABC transporter permease PotH [Rhodobacterales bacterium]|nr:MAG: putrescine ABC transporter permease PotH [Rhodobacterales bacterium]